MSAKSMKIVNRVVDSFLIVLGMLLIIIMGRQIWGIGSEIFQISEGNPDQVIHDVLSFFLFFEFFTMILRYLQEDHHLPIRYLIYICITAILRHQIGSPTNALDTLLVSISILVLVCTLVIMQKTISKGAIASENESEPY